MGAHERLLTGHLEENAQDRVVDSASVYPGMQPITQVQRGDSITDLPEKSSHTADFWEREESDRVMPQSRP